MRKYLLFLIFTDSDDAHYAERVKLIARRFEEQFSAVLQHILGGRSALESVVTQVFVSRIILFKLKIF